VKRRRRVLRERLSTVGTAAKALPGRDRILLQIKKKKKGATELGGAHNVGAV